METQLNNNQTQLNVNNEIPLPSSQDRPPCGGDFGRKKNENCIVVDVPLDCPEMRDDGIPYTPPPEDYEKVVEASLGVPAGKLGFLAKMEVDRIYIDGLCGRARGHTKKATPFKNWVAYVVKCLWTAYDKGLLRGCRQPRMVVVKV